MTGRRRLVPELTSKNGQVRAAAERETVNMPIQGTAADVLKKAMIDVHAALDGLQRRPAEAGANDPHRPRRAAVRGARRPGRRGRRPRRATSWSGAYTLDVPLTVDVGIDRNWNDAKP